MEEIIVTIAPDGSLSYKVQGVKGKSCKELTKAIDELGQVESSKTTAEYHQLGVPNQVQNKQSL